MSKAEEGVTRLDYADLPPVTGLIVALLADAGVDTGYCAQRQEMAGEEKHRALLARYPLVLQGPAVPNARAVLYRSLKGTAWSPVERIRSGDDLSIHLTPVGDLIQRHGLAAAAPWLPLCEALLRRRSGWIALGEDLGHILLAVGGLVRCATLDRTLSGSVVSVGLHAARLGGATALAIDSPLLALADAEGAAEHTQAHLHDDWADATAVIPFEPMPVRRVPAVGPGAVLPQTPPSGSGISPRVLPLWQHLVDHRYGFDLLRKGEGAPVMGEVVIKLTGGTATLVCHWLRADTADPQWPALCTAARLDPRRALPWTFHVARHVHLFQDEQPAFADTETKDDMRYIHEALAAAAQRLQILCRFRGNFVY